MKPSVQAEKHLAKNYPISCRPELHQAAGRGTPQLGPKPQTTPCALQSCSGSARCRCVLAYSLPVQKGIPVLCVRAAQLCSLMTESQMPGWQQCKRFTSTFGPICWGLP